MQPRSFRGWPNNQRTISDLSRGAILVRLHTPGGHRISIRSQSCHLLRVFLRILCRVDRGGCALRRLTERREVTNHLVMLGMALAGKVMAWGLPAQMMPYPGGGPEGGVLLGCRMTNGRDSGKIIM